MKAWEENIRKVVPYIPGEQPKLDNIIKLNTNENPYPPTPKAVEAASSFDMDLLRKYPDPTVSVLVDELAKRYGLKPSQVFVGVGSDDVISMAFLTFFNGKKPILFPDISYSFYSVWADVYRIPYETPALDENFKIKREDYFRENGGIIFPNPNAPTGVYEDLEFIEDIVAHNQDSVVIVDEAYIDFGGKSALELTKKYENLLIVQTFSKSRSMAGLRIGFAMGSEKLICALNDVKFSINSYTMNQCAINLGVWAVKDEVYFQRCVNKIIKTREESKRRMRELGFTFPDSMANFIFATHRTVPAKQIFEALREAGIFVRYFDAPRIDNYLRITVGTDGEMEVLFGFLEEYLRKQ